jgi:hypothetical protein
MSAIFVSFTSSVPSIANGGSFSLAWDVTGAKSLHLSSSDGLSVPEMALNSMLTVTPTAKDSAVTYTLTATDPLGVITTEKLAVDVGAASPVLPFVPPAAASPVVPAPGLVPSPALSAAKIVSFTSSVAAIPDGGSFVLSWNVTGAESLTLSSSDGLSETSLPFTGSSQSITPSAKDAAVVYTLSATDSAGLVAFKKLTVNVGNVPAAVPPGPKVRQIFSATGLPPGMIMTEHGELVGTPTAAGTFHVQVKLIDSLGNTLQTEAMPFTVNPGGGGLVISPSSLPPATQGTPHKVQFSTQPK